MKDTELLQMALGLKPPWQVSTAEFNPDKKRLDICLDFPKGSTFTCPKCGLSGVKVRDAIEKTWRHLNFFQHEAYLTARVARIDCDKCGTHSKSYGSKGQKVSGFRMVSQPSGSTR